MNKSEFIQAFKLTEKEENSGDVILVGHSAGAQAALRYAEEFEVNGYVLVSATFCALGGMLKSEHRDTTQEKNKQSRKNP